MKKNKLIITKKGNAICYGYFRDGIPIELYCEAKDRESLVGNIYAARVERVAGEMHAAFLEIGQGRKCYYPLKAKPPVKLAGSKGVDITGGDLLLVQVTKDAVKTKLPAADSNISLSGKYFVLTLSDKRSGISHKIKKMEERQRLLDITASYKTGDYGIVIRTNAQNVGEQTLTEELSDLVRRYEDLMRRARIAPGSGLLYREPPHYITLGKELPKTELGEIVTDQADIFEELCSYYREEGHCGDMVSLSYYEDDYALYNLYRFSHYLSQAAGKVVWLKSGASLVIEPTEAMTVIDVNTGSVLKKKRSSESLFFEINKEAACEIARQLRLRNLSGIILIDFINMKEKDLQEKILSILASECGQDRIRCRVIDMTALGLVEMTRNKVRRPLHEQIAACGETF